MIKLKIHLKQIDQFITSHLLNLFKSFKKANFTMNKTTPLFKKNSKTIKFLLSQTKYKKILFKNEKIAFNLQSPLKLKIKQRSKILSKCKRDLNLSKKLKNLSVETQIQKELKSFQRRQRK